MFHTKPWALPRIGLLGVLLALATTSPTFAKEDSESATAAPAMQSLDSTSGERPWAADVPEERQKAANGKFVEGNSFLDESSFREAAAKYREALELWDHPAIHYNLALALDIQDDPIGTRENLLAALRYGQGPLGEVRINYAKRLLQKLENQLAPIEIVCNAPGATINLDHSLVFQSPGRYAGFVKPGDHLIQATRPGYAQSEYMRTLLPGKPTKINIQFYTEDVLIEKHNRWPFWIPVTITAGGAAVAALGGVFLAESNSKYRAFDQRVNTDPNCANGCQMTPELSDMQSSGRNYKIAAGIAFVAGGAAFVTGAVMMVLDIPVSARITPEEYEKKLQLQPAVGANYVGLSGRARF